MTNRSSTTLRARVSGFFEDDNYRNALVFVVGLNVLYIIFFYNKGWIPNDDGWYGHVSRRLVNGKVFPRDVEELHPGYIHFVHLAAMKLFGTTLVAMRYPLMLLMALQSIGVYLLFRRTGWAVATTAAVVMSSFGAIEIVNPTPGLYAEALAVGAVALLIKLSPASRYRLLSLGVVLGLIFMFRQLSAVFVVMGSFIFLFTENQDDLADQEGTADAAAERTRWSAWAPQTTIALFGLMLLYYLYTSATEFSWVFFGIAPLLVLVWGFKSVTINNRRWFSMMTQIGTGSLLSTVPLIAYLLYHQSLGLWFQDTFIHSFKVNSVTNTATNTFWSDYVVHSISNLVVAKIDWKINGVYWLFLLGSSLILAFALLRRLMALYARGVEAGRFKGLTREYALPLVAIFYAQVTIISEVPYYLYLGVGFSLIASLWIWKVIPPLARTNTAASQDRLRRIHIGFMWFSIAVALIFHAGQPFTRNHIYAVTGRKFELVQAQTPNMGLWVPPWEDEHYLKIVGTINEISDPDDSLFAIPNIAELYVFAERDNPFRLINPTLSLTTDEDFEEFYAEFEESTPEVIVYDTSSNYAAGSTTEMIEHITQNFELVDEINGVEIYKHNG